MQARTEVALSRQREVMAEARALLALQHRIQEDRVRAAEETARRKALDEFMADIRVEHRQFERDRNCLILQERIYLRNIPLTGWTEHQVPGVTSVLTSRDENQSPKLLEPVMRQLQPTSPLPASASR
jgi:hypothetical protein